MPLLPPKSCFGGLLCQRAIRVVAERGWRGKEGRKKPAVISSESYNHSRDDLIIMAITSRLYQVNKPGEEPVGDWQGAGLLKPSVFKPILATVENRLVLRKLGRLQAQDCRALEAILQEILGG